MGLSFTFDHYDLISCTDSPFDNYCSIQYLLITMAISCVKIYRLGISGDHGLKTKQSMQRQEYEMCCNGYHVILFYGYVVSIFGERLGWIEGE